MESNLKGIFQNILDLWVYSFFLIFINVSVYYWWTSIFYWFVIFKDLKKNIVYLLLLMYHLKHLNAMYMITTPDLKINKNLFSTLKSDSYDFKIFRKPAITNVQIKSNSNMAANVSASAFKRFLFRAYKICSERFVVFNRLIHREWLWRNNFGKTTKNYLNELKNPAVNSKDTSEDISKVIERPWIPIIGAKLRQAFKMKNIKTIFTSGANSKSLLCRNKTKLLPNSYPGGYELKCLCNSVYFGENKK